MVSNGSHRREVEVRQLWRMNVEDSTGEVATKKPCKMQNASLDIFICDQIASCDLECSQRSDQEANQDYVFRQRLKMRMLVERTMQGAGDARRD